MPTDFKIQATNVDPAPLGLSRNLSLEEWSDSFLVALPRGILRHVIHFVQLNKCVVAVKKIGAPVACHKYVMSHDLSRLNVSSVVPTAVITGRTGDNDEELNAVLITEHLQFSLPYRALFFRHMAPDTATRLTGAFAVLLVYLHLLGFYWRDVSLSNALFRRDADSFSAYLVDTETEELHPKLISEQYAYDADIACVDIIGEFMDLQAGAFFPEGVGPIHIDDRICSRYETLWNEFTSVEMIDASRKWRVARKIGYLSELGFDIGEFNMLTVAGASTLKIQPKVVDAGHHRHKLMRLTRMDAEENQTQRLPNDIQALHTVSGRLNSPLELNAHEWFSTAFEPVIAAVPPEFADKLESAQIYHKFLEHRWYLAESVGHDIPLDETIASYVKNVLAVKRGEALYIISESDAENPTPVVNSDLW